MTGEPLRFCFGLHLHQPVGNFDHVFQQHLDQVYRPLLSALMEGEAWPVALHLSGPLLDWLELHAPEYLDQLARYVDDGQVELLSAGHDEPILAVLPQQDRIEQIVRHQASLRQRFGVEASGLWLTERVWEPDLPETLVAAGVDFVLVDDRHFLVSGFPRSALHQHYLTESGGARVGLFPIDEQLRYLIPFRPVQEFVVHIRERRAAGDTLAVMADDGEKFGGWPGTADWLYQQGWLNSFLGTLRELRDRGELQLSRFDQAWQTTPSAGLAYLPSASYHEMEEWSLPLAPARALTRLETEWGRTRITGIEGGLLRGGHWRHFLVKYVESNRLHKTMLRLSLLSRERGDPPEVRRHIGRAQCNDAYWHGVFGGLYLPFLRAALWRELALAESLLRQGESIQIVELDWDADGNQELLICSKRFSAVVAPRRGGSVEVYLDLEMGQNILDTLTRRREPYHYPPDEQLDSNRSEDAGTASIHELVSGLDQMPPVDLDTRALFVDRLVGPDTSLDHFLDGNLPVLQSWSNSHFVSEWRIEDGVAVISLKASGLHKILRLGNGFIEVEWQWEPNPAAAWFTTELSLSAELTISATEATRWDYSIETVARSEGGFDRTVQGQAVVLLWPVNAGKARARIELCGSE